MNNINYIIQLVILNMFYKKCFIKNYYFVKYLLLLNEMKNLIEDKE